MIARLWRRIFDRVTYAEYLPRQRRWVRRYTALRMFKRIIRKKAIA